MRKIWGFILIFAFAGSTPAWGGPRKIKISVWGSPPQNSWQEHGAKTSEGSSDYSMVGMVSWYGRGFHGRRTASGERYNMHALTCASRELPFGTVLELTNLENGEKVRVRVNDRGPVFRSRILDVSFAAAKKLRFVGKGQTKVQVRVLEEKAAEAIVPPSGQEI